MAEYGFLGWYAIVTHDMSDYIADVINVGDNKKVAVWECFSGQYAAVITDGKAGEVFKING